MDGATLQAKIYASYAQTAKRIGLAYSIYRPTDPLNPLANLIGTIPAHFRVDDKFARPNVYGKALWLAYFDGSQTAVGDYLVATGGKTLFVAAMQPLLPILTVECNRVVTISRIDAPTGAGALSYNADSGNETPYMTGWPSSILQGPKGEKNEVGLPGDVRQAWWVMLVPAWAGLTVEASDIVTDDLGRRYITSSCELTDLGWRVTLQQAVT